MTETAYCATVIYPFTEGVEFDLKRYASDIAPRYARLLGDNCLGFEVREGRTSPGRRIRTRFASRASGSAPQKRSGRASGASG